MIPDIQLTCECDSHYTICLPWDYHVGCGMGKTLTNATALVAQQGS